MPAPRLTDMTSIFSRIIAGEIPARFIWQDEHCVAFLTVAPLTSGHTLVVPREEITQWTEAPGEVLAHLMNVARTIGQAQQAHWKTPRVGLLAQGFEVPHLHLHVWPTASPEDFDLRRADHDPDPARMDADARALRDALRTLGHAEHVLQD